MSDIIHYASTVVKVCADGTYALSNYLDVSLGEMLAPVYDWRTNEVHVQTKWVIGGDDVVSQGDDKYTIVGLDVIFDSPEHYVISELSNPLPDTGVGN